MYTVHYDSWQFIIGSILLCWTLLEIVKRRALDIVTFTFEFTARDNPFRYYVSLLLKLSLGAYLILQSREIVYFL
jgi:hypothetical protein